jgi:tetratricopeptide (TPR) repeat protein
MLKRRWCRLPVILLILALAPVAAMAPSPPEPALAFGAQTPEARSTASGPAAKDEVFERIDSLIGLRQFDEAERLLDHHLARSANPASEYFQMGKLYFEHQEWSRSAPCFQKSLRLQNQNDQAHLLLGLVWRELKRPDDAEPELLAAASLNPRSGLNVYMAGQQLLIDGKYEGALGYLYKAVALDPHNAAAYRALGMDHARLGNYGLAEDYYQKAIEAARPTAPEAATARADLAFLLLLGHDRAQLSKGLRLAQQAAELEPSSADAHYLSGKALLKLGRTKEAVPELLRAEGLDPRDSKPHFLLAQAYDRLGEDQKARAERQAFLRIRERSTGPGMATGELLPRDSD